MRLKGKTALITGSATGLGKMTALALAEQGCDIAINYVHSQTEAFHLTESIRALGQECIAVQADISKSEDLKRLMDDVNVQLGNIDILINNAGPFIRERQMFADYTSEEMDYLMRGNLIGVMELDQLIIPQMRASGWGRIIHFGFGRASEARGWPQRAVYAAAKVGLVSFTKSLAAEEAGFGITINMICPGDIRGNNKEKHIQDVQYLKDDESPRGRPGSGEDVSRVVTFLCDPSSDFLTGNILDVSGGLDPIRNLIQN